MPRIFRPLTLAGLGGFPKTRPVCRAGSRHDGTVGRAILTAGAGRKETDSFQALSGKRPTSLQFATVRSSHAQAARSVILARYRGSMRSGCADCNRRVRRRRRRLPPRTTPGSTVAIGLCCVALSPPEPVRCAANGDGLKSALDPPTRVSLWSQRPFYLILMPTRKRSNGCTSILQS